MRSECSIIKAAPVRKGILFLTQENSLLKQGRILKNTQKTPVRKSIPFLTGAAFIILHSDRICQQILSKNKIGSRPAADLAFDLVVANSSFAVCRLSCVGVRESGVRSQSNISSSVSIGSEDEVRMSEPQKKTTATGGLYSFFIFPPYSLPDVAAYARTLSP